MFYLTAVRSEKSINGKLDENDKPTDDAPEVNTNGAAFEEIADGDVDVESFDVMDDGSAGDEEIDQTEGDEMANLQESRIFGRAPWWENRIATTISNGKKKEANLKKSVKPEKYGVPRNQKDARPWPKKWSWWGKKKDATSRHSLFKKDPRGQ